MLQDLFVGVAFCGHDSGSCLAKPYAVSPACTVQYEFSAQILAIRR